MSQSDNSDHPVVYYELEDVESSEGRTISHYSLRIPSSEDELRLTISPERRNESDLLLRIDVWNLTRKIQFVHPIGRFDYPLEFRERNGKPIWTFAPMIGDTPIRLRDELVRLYPGNVLTQYRRIPAFYTRVSKGQVIECRIEVRLSHWITLESREAEWFELASGWVEIPNP